MARFSQMDPSVQNQKLRMKKSVKRRIRLISVLKVVQFLMIVYIILKLNLIV